MMNLSYLIDLSLPLIQVYMYVYIYIIKFLIKITYYLKTIKLLGSFDMSKTKNKSCENVC